MCLSGYSESKTAADGPASRPTATRNTRAQTRPLTSLGYGFRLIHPNYQIRKFITGSRTTRGSPR